ncbi:MAG: ABC transporter permease [Thermaerobacter sp.]|nr:ABC transporter permease [Thermaerobacter sp.]
MTWLDSMRVAVAGMWHNKLRAFLTTLGIIIGVGAVVVLVSIGQGATRAVTSRIETLGTNLVFVTPGAGTPFTEQTATTIRSVVPLPITVVPMVQTHGAVSTVAASGSGAVVGTVPDYLRVGAIHLAAGRFFTTEEMASDPHVAVVGANLVASLFNGQSPIGQSMLLMGQQFRVIGALDPVGQGPGASQDNAVFIPLSTASALLRTNQLSQVIVKTMNPNQAALVANLLTNFYTNQLGANAVTVASEDQVLQTLRATRATLAQLLTGTAAIALIVGGIGIMNIMLVSVTERTREIGVRRALGATREDIVLQFLLEAMAISVTGGLLGLGVGGALVVVAPHWFHTPVTFSPLAMVLAFVFSGAVGVVFGLYPAFQASHKDPIHALRYDG